MTAVEISQAAIRSDISSLSVPPTTLAIIKLPATIRGRMILRLTLKNLLLILKGHVAMEDDKAKEEPTRKHTKNQIQAYMDKEEQNKKAAEEVKIFEMTKTEGAEHQVLKREHSQKTKREMELRMKRFEQYTGTTSSKLRPEPITNVKIHPNTKPTVFTIYKAIDKINFQVHNPFKFANFRVTKLDELGPIIQKKKNIIVKDLMTSLSKRYERMMIILKELRIQSALPALVLEQAPSESSGMKKKHIELEPKIKVPGLECNKSLPEGVPFINNMVNKEHEYGIFFSDVFGDQAFQR
nr:hypothetical protein [Tanacetum cinerariifolium]